MAASADQCTFRLNGRDVSVAASPGTALVFVLRNQPGILSPKLGCGTEQCGACRVLVDGKLAYSCTLPLERVVGRNVDTLERFIVHPVVEASAELIDRPHERSLGAGEATQGPTTAAVANAVFWATGIRVRDLPITPDALRKAAGR